MMRQFTLTAAAILFSAQLATASELGRDPRGESAKYELDRAPARTTGLIREGSGLASVTEFLPDHEQGPSYNVQLDYDVTVQFYGHQKGTAKWPFHQDFFDPSFMANLRQTGHYETADYKIRHEGFADARNPDGTVYPHCDKILIYDVKVPEGDGFQNILNLAAGMSPEDKAAPIENLQIRAHVFAEAPVLGAVKLDLSGVARGMNVKAGFDYKK